MWFFSEVFVTFLLSTTNNPLNASSYDVDCWRFFLYTEQENIFKVNKFLPLI